MGQRTGELSALSVWYSGWHLLAGMLTGIAAMLAVTRPVGRTTPLPAQTRPPSPVRSRSSLLDAASGVLVGMGLAIGLSVLRGPLHDALLNGALAGSMLSDASSDSRRRQPRVGIGPRSIDPAEKLRWSDRRGFRSALAGLACALPFALLVAFFAALLPGTPSAMGTLLAFLATELVGGLLAASGGLVGDTVDVRVRPNEGIRRSARTAIIVGTIATLLFGAAIAVLILGARIAALPAERCGDRPLLPRRRRAVRSAHLWRLRLPVPLGAASDPLALRRCAVELCCLPGVRDRPRLPAPVGGGYGFLHRLVQEHFADEPHLLASLAERPAQPAEPGLRPGSPVRLIAGQRCRPGRRTLVG